MLQPRERRWKKRARRARLGYRSRDVMETFCSHSRLVIRSRNWLYRYNSYQMNLKMAVVAILIFTFLALTSQLLQVYLHQIWYSAWKRGPGADFPSVVTHSKIQDGGGRHFVFKRR